MIILDIKLPGIDGFRVCKLIRKYGSKAIIIAITGYHTEENRKKILSAGADYYFKKPLDMQELMNTVKKACKIH